MILNKLFESAIENGVTSDKHIDNVYEKVREVASNITNDKNRTVFAFVNGITKSNLV